MIRRVCPRSATRRRTAPVEQPETDWNVSAAARLLDTERTALHKRIRTLGLKRSHGNVRLAELAD
jgi:hypothetical protein